MGQFSMQEMAVFGSIFGANQQYEVRSIDVEALPAVLAPFSTYHTG